jgi:hypothetical protein
MNRAKQLQEHPHPQVQEHAHPSQARPPMPGPFLPPPPTSTENAPAGAQAANTKPSSSSGTPSTAFNRTSLESGRRSGDDEELPSLRELAAPLVDLVGSALSKTASASASAAAALKRRGTAAAAAATAAAGDGRGAVAAAAAAAFALSPEELTPPPPAAADGESAVALRAVAEVDAARQALRLTCEAHTATLGQQREALSSASARQVDETLGIARKRVAELATELAIEAARSPSAIDAGSQAPRAVDACAALREARETRAHEAEASVRTFERRVEALRATRTASGSTGIVTGCLDAGGGMAGTCIGTGVSSTPESAAGASAEVAAAERALR